MPENFRNIYKIARRAAGYTQEAAAEMLNVSVESIRAYETGRRIPAGDVVEQMVICYNAQRLALQHLQETNFGYPEFQDNQKFSVAGKRRGKDDDRYLWPEMLRVINELRPTWVVGENVAGIVNMALDQVLSDLEDQGYQTRAFIIPACGVAAPHRRDRCAIVAYSPSRHFKHSMPSAGVLKLHFVN